MMRVFSLPVIPEFRITAARRQEWLIQGSPRNHTGKDAHRKPRYGTQRAHRHGARRGSVFIFVIMNFPVQFRRVGSFLRHSGQVSVASASRNPETTPILPMWPELFLDSGSVLRTVRNDWKKWSFRASVARPGIQKPRRSLPQCQYSPGSRIARCAGFRDDSRRVLRGLPG